MSKEIKDIQSFLMTKGILWNGVDRNNTNEYILADVRMLRRGDFVDAEIYLKVDDITFNCMITYPINKFTDKTITKDFSIDWIKYRLAQYPGDAPLIKSAIEEKMKAVQEKSETEIQELKNKIKNIKLDEEKHTKHLRRLINIVDANNYSNEDNLSK